MDIICHRLFATRGMFHDFKLCWLHFFQGNFLKLMTLFFGFRDAGYVADNPNYAKCRKLLQVYFYAVESKEDNFYG